MTTYELNEQEQRAVEALRYGEAEALANAEWRARHADDIAEARRRTALPYTATGEWQPLKTNLTEDDMQPEDRHKFDDQKVKYLRCAVEIIGKLVAEDYLSIDFTNTDENNGWHRHFMFQVQAVAESLSALEATGSLH